MNLFKKLIITFSFFIIPIIFVSLSFAANANTSGYKTAKNYGYSVYIDSNTDVASTTLMDDTTIYCNVKDINKYLDTSIVSSDDTGNSYITLNDGTKLVTFYKDKNYMDIGAQNFFTGTKTLIYQSNNYYIPMKVLARAFDLNTTWENDLDQICILYDSTKATAMASGITFALSMMTTDSSPYTWTVGCDNMENVKFVSYAGAAVKTGYKETFTFQFVNSSPFKLTFTYGLDYDTPVKIYEYYYY